jgi:hypothetical protein
VRIQRVVAISSVLMLGIFSVVATSAKTPQSPLSSIKEIKDLKDIEAVVAEGGAMRTLLVLDIDDTLLTAPGFFGSDAWYQWQSGLAKDDPDKLPCVYDLIAMNYESGVQIPTQPDGPGIINALSADKIILTSRSLASRAATIRELQAAGYELPQPLGQKLDGRIFQADPNNPKSATISYHRGIFMGSGQDKGKLLSQLIDTGALKYDRVVFVDDGLKNIESMRVAMEAQKIEYRGLFYTRISKDVTPERKRLADNGWVEWQHFLAMTFPDRLARIKAKEAVCGY